MRVATRPPRRIDRLATAAVVLGVVSVPFAVLLVPGLLAVVFGVMARSIRRAWTGILLGAVTFGAGAVVWITIVPGILDATSYRNLAVGDCYRRPGDDPTYVRRQSCTGPHDRVVVATVEHPAPRSAPWPGWEVLRQYATQTCAAAAEARLGMSLAASSLSSYPIYATRESWADGNRRIVCAVGNRDHTPLVGALTGRLP